MIGQTISHYRITETLAAVGQRFSVSRERIRQIEAKALRKLRHPEELKQREEEKLGATLAIPSVLSAE